MAIFEMVISSSFPINGYYNYSDVFQILPLKDNIYRNSMKVEYNKDYYKAVKYANKHLIRNKNYIEHIDSINHQDFLKEIMALLSLVCNDTFVCNDKCPSIIYQKDTKTSFSDISKLQKIRKIEKLIYNDMRSVDEFVSIDKNADLFFSNYFLLKDFILERYRMSLMLYYNSIFIRAYSPSMAFVSLISAIENLMDVDNKIQKITPEKCPICNQLKYKLNANFKEFVLKYYDIPEKNMNKYLNDVYSLRSKITHAGELFYMDFATSEFPLKEYHDFNKLMKVVRVCLLNYICLCPKTHLTPAST